MVALLRRVIARLPGSQTLPLSGLLLVGLSSLCLSAIGFFRVPLLPDMGRDLSMSTTELGLLTTAFAFGRLVTDIPSGRLSDIAAPTRLLAGTATLLGVGSALLATAAAASWAVAAAFVLGVASATAHATAMPYFSTSLPAALRGRAVAAYSGAMLGGQALGPTVAGLLATIGSWRSAIAIGAGSAFALALALTAVRHHTSAGRVRAAPGRHDARHGDPLPLLPHQRVALFAIPFAGWFLMSAVPQTLVPILGADNFGLNAGVIGLALGAAGVCRFIGAWAGGVLADRVSRKAALIPALASQAVGVLLFAVDTTVVAWFAAIVVMALGSFDVSTASTILVDRTAVRDVGRQLGPFRFVGDLGLVAGPVTATWVYASFGTTVAVASMAAMMAAVAAAAAIFLPETRWSGGRGPAVVRSSAGRS